MPVVHRPRLLAILALMVALAAFPLASLASHDFADVPDSNPFHTDISALAATGVTTGCGGGNYCPSAFVTREQMAAFMNRLGALAPGKTPVVNATQLDGLDSDEFLRVGEIVMANDLDFTPQVFGGHMLGVQEWGGIVRLYKTFYSTEFTVLYLAGPTQIGLHQYGLAAIELCWGGATDFTISGMEAWDADVLLVNDTSDTAASGAGCRSVSVSVPVAASGTLTFRLLASVVDTSVLNVRSVRTSWMPVN
jgi:hypothetical protein